MFLFETDDLRQVYTNNISKKSEGERTIPEFDPAFDDDGPNEITISFWELGGHPDLIPVLHPFITGDVNNT